MFFPNLEAIATRDVLTIDFNATVQAAVDRMHAFDHRNIIVTNGAIFYLLTTSDLITLRLDGTDFSTPLSSLDLRQVPILSGEENVITAISLVNREHEYICLTDDDGILTGIVTNSDIVASVDPQIMFESTSLQSLFETHHNYSLVEGSEPMSHAITLLQHSQKDCIIITEEGRLNGIVTSKDILRYLNDPHKDRPVSDFMSYPLHTLPATTSIKEALRFVTAKHYKRIVVTSEEGALVGIISQQDLIAQTYLRWSKLVKEHYHEIKELTKILEQKNRQLMQLATKDSLTGIDNRHTFEEQFERERTYAKRHHLPLHLMILDVDHFKEVNDTYGHLIGDSILKEFSTLIRQEARSSDLFARWGGEEFVLMLRNSSDDDAMKVAEKLRHSVAVHDFENVGRLTCSIGLCLVDPEQYLGDNLSRADQALYRAKHKGRNRVSAHQDLESIPGNPTHIPQQTGESHHAI